MIADWSAYTFPNPMSASAQVFSILLLDDKQIAGIDGSGLEADAGEVMAHLFDQAAADLRLEGQMLRMSGIAVRQFTRECSNR